MLQAEAAIVGGMLQAEQQESMVVLQAGAVEVCYSAASKAARYGVMLQAGAAVVKLDMLQEEQQRVYSCRRNSSLYGWQYSASKNQ